MSDLVRENIKQLLDEQPSYVGELAYFADEELPRSFGKLMAATHNDGASADELLRNLEAFGEAVHRVGDRYARVSEYYRQLRQVAQTQQGAG